MLGGISPAVVSVAENRGFSETRRAALDRWRVNGAGLAIPSVPVSLTIQQAFSAQQPGHVVACVVDGLTEPARKTERCLVG